MAPLNLVAVCKGKATLPSMDSAQPEREPVTPEETKKQLAQQFFSLNPVVGLFHDKFTGKGKKNSVQLLKTTAPSGERLRSLVSHRMGKRSMAPWMAVALEGRRTGPTCPFCGSPCIVPRANHAVVPDA
jgi:hypothetical protein